MSTGSGGLVPVGALLLNERDGTDSHGGAVVSSEKPISTDR